MLACVGAACGGANTETSNVAVPGAWTLQSINGTVLPAPLQESQAGPVETVVSSTLVTAPAAIPTSGSASGTFTEVITATIAGMTQTFSETGTWVANGGALTFNDQTNAQRYTGSVTSNTLTKNENGFAEVYAR